MPIPAVLAEHLSTHGVSYQLIDEESIEALHPSTTPPTVAAETIVRLLLLEHDHGTVQVMVAANCLLDLPYLSERMGYDLRAANPQLQERLARAQGLDSHSALPLDDTMPLVIDSRLKRQATLFFELDTPQQFIQLDQADFAKLVQRGEEFDCGIPLESLCDPDDDRAAVERSVKQFTKLRIQRRLQETLEMPPLPSSAERIIQLRLDPEAGVGELAKVVEQDPSLAAQVVSWASSPYYAAPGAVRSVHDAVIRVLGFDLVISLALGLSLGQALVFPVRDSEVKAYWEQAVFTAGTMEGLVKAMNRDERPSVGLAYLSGLLSNFGYLILAHVFPPYFASINRSIAVNNHVEDIYSERHLLGLDQDIISSQLLDSWSMPEEVVCALRWQHRPEFEGDLAVYPRLLYVSTQLLRRAKLIEGPVYDLPDSYLTDLGLSREKADSALERVLSQREELASIARLMMK